MLLVVGYLRIFQNIVYNDPYLVTGSMASRIRFLKLLPAHTTCVGFRGSFFCDGRG